MNKLLYVYFCETYVNKKVLKVKSLDFTCFPSHNLEACPGEKSLFLYDDDDDRREFDFYNETQWKSSSTWSFLHLVHCDVGLNHDEEERDFSFDIAS